MSTQLHEHHRAATEVPRDSGHPQRALRELLAEGLIILIGSRDDPEESEIPRARHDHVLRAWDTWTLGSPGIKASYRISDAG